MNNCYFILFISFINFTFLSCSNDDGTSLPTVYGQYELQADNSVTLTGSINANSETDLKDLLSDHTDVSKLVILSCTATQLAEETINTATLIRDNNLHTHLDENATISRGGLDIFLAGTKRTKDEGAQIGVGAWRDASGNIATDFEFGDSVHTPYLNFYVDMGINYSLASDFYYFSIQAAGPDEVFILTDELIENYKLLKE